MISVIIPTYNRPHLIGRAISSVRAQTYKDYEIIVIDDGSEQDYGAVLKNYPEIKYVKFPVNKGKSAVQNHGAKIANGEYIVFLDDDNEFLPEFLEKSLDTLKRENTYAVQVGRIISDEVSSYAKPSDGTFATSIDWGWLMKKSVFDTIQYDETLYADEDMDFGIRFFMNFTKSNIDEPLQIAHANDNDSMCAPTPRRLQGLDNFLKKNIDFYKTYGNANELRYLYRLAGRNYYPGGYRLKGIYYFWKSFLSMKNWKTFQHLLFILLGWSAYSWFMNYEQRR